MQAKRIADLLYATYFKWNWTGPNLFQILEGVDHRLATQKLDDFNTIATLVYHLNYYIHEHNHFFRTGELKAKDELSFNHPPIESEADWQALLDSLRADVAEWQDHVSAMPDEQLEAPFIDPKYGTFYRNLHGVIEHANYHMGQIAIIKKELINRNS